MTPVGDASLDDKMGHRRKTESVPDFSDRQPALVGRIGRSPVRSIE